LCETQGATEESRIVAPADVHSRHDGQRLAQWCLRQPDSHG
jgi:hypothetical protein